MIFSILSISADPLLLLGGAASATTRIVVMVPVGRASHGNATTSVPSLHLHEPWTRGQTGAPAAEFASQLGSNHNSRPVTGNALGR